MAPKPPTTSQDNITYLLLPPDGGYGWIIVCAGFLSMFIGDGTMTSFGLYLEDISKDLKSSEKVVAWATSTMNGCYFISGPIMCALVNRFGYRSIGVLGGLLAGGAFFWASYLENIISFIFVYGCLGGIGFSMMYFSTILIIAIYFDRWRGVAISIALSGSTGGSIALPQLILVVFKNYSWREQFRYFSLVTVCCGLVTLLYKPLYPFEIKTSEAIQASQHPIHQSDDEGDEISEFLQLFSISSALSMLSVKKAGFNKNKPRHAYHSKYSLDVQSLRMRAAAARLPHQKVSRRVRCKLFWTSKCCYEYSCDFFWLNFCELCCCCLIDERCCIHKGRPMNRKDILYTGSLYVLPEHHKHPDNKMGFVEYHMSVTNAIPIEEAQLDRKCCAGCRENFKNTLKIMFDFKAMKTPSFNLILLNSLMISMAYYPPVIYVTQKARSENVPDQILNLLLTIHGFAALFGRLFCIGLSSIPNLNGLIVIAVSSLLCGIGFIANNLYSHTANHITSMVVLGIFGACAFSLRTPMIVQLYGLDSLSSSFGLCMVAYGVAGFFGVPISAIIQEQTSSYNAVYYYAGTLAVVSGLIMLPVQCMRPREIIKEGIKRNNQPGPSNR